MAEVETVERESGGDSEEGEPEREGGSSRSSGELSFESVGTLEEEWQFEMDTDDQISGHALMPGAWVGRA